MMIKDADYDLGDIVKIIDGKFKNGIAEIVGIYLAKEDTEVKALYSLEITSDNRIHNINRSARHIRHTNIPYETLCYECLQVSKCAWSHLCVNCFIEKVEKLEDELALTRKLIADKKHLLLEVNENDVPERYKLFEELVSLVVNTGEAERQLNSFYRIKSRINE